MRLYKVCENKIHCSAVQIHLHLVVYPMMKNKSIKTEHSSDCESGNPSDNETPSRQDYSDGDNSDWFEEERQGLGAWMGQTCAWCMINHSDIPLFFLSFIVLYLSINKCCYCVMIVAIISALLCMRFPLLNATLWSSLVVLYLHKDWNLNFGNVKLTWNRST